jgi:hypothetical protein
MRGFDDVPLNESCQCHGYGVCDGGPTPNTAGKSTPEFKYIQHSTKIFDVVKLKFVGLFVPKSIYDPAVPGKLTAVLLVGAFVTSAALP